jgi:hypothetical protein
LTITVDMVLISLMASAIAAGPDVNSERLIRETVHVCAG